MKKENANCWRIKKCDNVNEKKMMTKKMFAICMRRSDYQGKDEKTFTNAFSTASVRL